MRRSKFKTTLALTLVLSLVLAVPMMTQATWSGEGWVWVPDG